MLEFLVCGRVRQKKPVFVSSTEAANDASAANGGFNDRDDICQLGLECAVEILRTSDGNQTVGIRQLREHPNLARVLELQPGSHGFKERLR